MSSPTPTARPAGVRSAAALKIYSTLARRKEPFETVHPGEVRMYVCGPNVYGPSHVGHAMSYVVFDVVRRYLTYRGYRVRYVQNFTDIEDRIIETAAAEGTTIAALAERYMARFMSEMDALGVRHADVYPRATHAIPKMIEIIRELESRGLAYAAGGDVFFRVLAFPGYGRLSGRSLDEMMAGARVDVDPRKEHPMDFVLWKASKPGEPAWDSPWGRGRPGWHIECTAMSMEFLGPQLDIHGGGQDVVFPHHENEIAQSEGYTGKRFVRYWMHNGLLRLTGGPEKMTRHLGGIVTIREALDRYHPDTLRVFILSSHYRNPLTWTDEALAAAAAGAERLRTARENAEDLLTSEAAPGADAPDVTAVLGALAEASPAARTAVEASMDDDFGTPGALAALFDLATAVNRVTDAAVRRRARLSPPAARTVWEALDTLRELSGVLGLRLVTALTPAQTAALADLARRLSEERPDLFNPEERPDGAAPAEFGPALVDYIARGRVEARRRKDFATGDRVRGDLSKLGVLLEDTITGFKWRVR
ncbi:MAG TPA: cysteine--tRNA ligase [bacterium]|nr:cysteine--tRNA ligase [bacterium]